MPTLPKPLRRPHPWLGLLLLGGVLFTVDIQREPSHQLTPHVYGAGIKSYQWVKPKCGFEGSCRFTPSCSRYSKNAVERFGFRKGIKLTIDRISRCKTDIPKGTSDPVPSLP